MLKLRQNSSLLIFFTLLSALLTLTLFLNMIHHQKRAKEGVFIRNYLGDLIFSSSFASEEEEGDLKYYDNTLYSENIYNSQIVAFDTSGTVVKIYGKKREDHLSSIIGWHVDETGIYLIDQKRKVFEHLNFDNQLLYEHKTEKLFYGAGKLTGNKFIIHAPRLSKSNPGERFKLRFLTIDLDNQKVENLNNPLPDMEYGTLKLDGHYLKNTIGQVFYVCKMAGLFFSIHEDGMLKYVAETIDKTPAPKIISSIEGIRYDPLAPRVNRSISANNDYLYILSDLKSLFDDGSFSNAIDMYNVKDGSYEYSIKVPRFKGVSAQKIAVSPSGDLYIRFGENIVYYKIRKPQPKTYILDSINQ